MAALIEVSVVFLSHCFVLFTCCLTQFLKIFGFISFFFHIYKLTWISRGKKVLLGNPDLSSQSGFVLLCS